MGRLALEVRWASEIHGLRGEAQAGLETRPRDLTSKYGESGGTFVLRLWLENAYGRWK